MDRLASTRRLRRELKVRCWAALGGLALRAFHATYRRRVLDPPWAERRLAGEQGRCIYALWHRDLWQLIPVFRDQGVAALVSRHSDGEIVARVLRSLGCVTVRGSSSRGGTQALREMLELARGAEGDLAVTIDGPRGPAGSIKPGILYAASRSGLPIVPLGAGVGRAWRARSWDRTVIGKPFGAFTAAMGPPLWVPGDATREELAGLHTRRLRAAMDAVAERASEAL